MSWLLFLVISQLKKQPKRRVLSAHPASSPSPSAVDKAWQALLCAFRNSGDGPSITRYDDPMWTILGSSICCLPVLLTLLQYEVPGRHEDSGVVL